MENEENNDKTKVPGELIFRSVLLVCFFAILDLQIDVSFSCVCPVIDHEFCHDIVRVAVDLQTTLTILWQNSLSITGQMQ